MFHNDSFTDGVTTLLKNECFEIISDDCRIPFGTRNEYKAKCKAFGILLNDKRLKIRPEFLNESKIKQDLFILAEAISQFSTDEINFLEIKFRELFPVIEIPTRRRINNKKFLIFNQLAFQWIMTGFCAFRGSNNLWTLKFKIEYIKDIMICALIMIDSFIRKKVKIQFINNEKGYGLVSTDKIIKDEILAFGLVSNTNLKKTKIEIKGEKDFWKNKGIYSTLYYGNSNYSGSSNSLVQLNHMNAGFLKFDQTKNLLVQYEYKLSICQLILAVKKVGKNSELTWKYDYVKSLGKHKTK